MRVERGRERRMREEKEETSLTINLIIIESGEQVYGGSLFCSFYFNMSCSTQKTLPKMEGIIGMANAPWCFGFCPCLIFYSFFYLH